MKGLFQNIQLLFAYLFKVINNKKIFIILNIINLKIFDNNKIQDNIFSFFLLSKINAQKNRIKGKKNK